MGEVFASHAEVFDQAGLGHASLNACCYAMGAIYNPIWVEFPVFYENNPTVMRESQGVLFAYDPNGQRRGSGHVSWPFGRGDRSWRQTPVAQCA